ncbi:hypothetical protein [Mangrovimonas sp. TPBH4]|uniref:hypothetical protein n=1 Tax=Mangrovimonas sp. TPBH4 TaxID=1645914 RepID=UPI0006B45E73|nr:hypothetical protein [Mangrovimonas sp. TPBH4]
MSNFHLNKWFLDFIGNNDETMIFYCAILSWKGFTAHYASCIHYSTKNNVKVKSHFFNVQTPEIKDHLITWKDDKFKVFGSWSPIGKPLHTRIFEDEDGYLDWNCFQPASSVKLNMNNIILEGKGYVEQLILTTLPWHIPMNDLRWGRFQSFEDTLVWIELRKENRQQWLWLNGEKITDCCIEDDSISSTEKSFTLKLDRKIELESEKIIFNLVQKLLKYLPGFKALMPHQFLMAKSYKWLSNGELKKKDGTIAKGKAIHEWVNFNTQD